MQLKYDVEAREKGVYVVGACGWDSIPFEMGISFLRQNFPGDLNSVEGTVEPKPAPVSIFQYCNSTATVLLVLFVKTSCKARNRFFF